MFLLIYIYIYINRNAQRKLHDSSIESRCCWLKFLQDIPPVVYTGENIVVKDTSIDIALFDAATGELVKYGPEAYAKVEIVLLNGDFDPSRDWTPDQFNIQIVGGRGRSSMLIGKDLYLKLQRGVGSVGEIKLKHGAQWMKKSKFRLGARVVHLPDTIEVREAVTGLFLIKDKRLKRNKRDPPSPSDEVWRLKRIGRDGPFHKKLFANDIRTVGDFLTEFSKNAARLRSILGPTMSDYTWNATLTHAQRCKWDDRQFLCYPSESCQEIAMVNRRDSFTDMPMNQHGPGFPPVSLDYGTSLQKDYFKKLMEDVNCDDAIIFEDPEQVPYAYQKSTPNNQMMLTCLEDDDDILECINELLALDEEPGKSCIMHSDKHKDHSKNWQQYCVIPGNVCCAFCNKNNFALPTDATVSEVMAKATRGDLVIFHTEMVLD